MTPGLHPEDGPAAASTAPADWELRHLRAFLAVIDHNGFTRASQALWVTQPSLSRTVAQLERLVGRRLFQRGSAGIQLTQAGQLLEPHARRVTEAADAAHAAVRALPATLRFGFTWNGLGEHTSKALQAFRQAHEGVTVRLVRCDDDPSAGLLDGRSDVAVIRGTPADPVIEHVVLYREPRVAVLPAGHALAQAEEISLAALSSENIVINRTTGTTPPALWGHRSGDEGLLPVGNIDEWIEAIASGQGVGISAASTQTLRPHPQVVYRPLPQAPPVPVALAWIREAVAPVAAEFVRTTCALLAN